MKLSILMPVYNEERTLQRALDRVLAVDYGCDVELVVVNDGSVDGTGKILDDVRDPRVLRHDHPANQGKGAAVRTAAGLASGDYVIMCDADLEYAPEQIPELLHPVLRGEAVVVYGTRSFGGHTAFSFWYVLGNKGVTMCANVLFNAWISDLETCFKLLPLDVYRALAIRSAGFGMEAELTAKLLKAGVRPHEIPISYRARRREAGKKLTWRDGVEALAILARVRVAHRVRPELAAALAARQPDV